MNEPKRIREHAKNRGRLDGADAQALEGALSQTERELARAEALAQEWRDTAEQYRIDLQVAKDDAESKLREVAYANDQRRSVIDALETKLAEAQALALANGLRADAEKSRAENLQAACEVLKRDRDAAHKRADAAHELLREWFQFDFDCPEEEYDAEEDCFEEDGSALAKLYSETAALLRASEAT